MPTVCERTSTSSGPIEGGSSSATTARSGASNTSAFTCLLLASSVELHATGDVDALTSHVSCAVRREERDCLADVLWLLRPAERYRIDELLPDLFARDASVLRELIEERLPQRSPDHARAHGVHANSVLGKLFGERL